jgi:hypothetical protein
MGKADHLGLPSLDIPTATREQTNTPIYPPRFAIFSPRPVEDLWTEMCYFQETLASPVHHATYLIPYLADVSDVAASSASISSSGVRATDTTEPAKTAKKVHAHIEA